jgi:hypothetical protein
MDINPVQFEQLLLEFCKQDLPPNFIVEHDIKEIGEESGNKRQIDVRIKGRLGISEILICGEAKNWNAEVGSETIDALVGKYLSGEIRANKVILFSNNGFTLPVITRSQKVGIELLQPKNLGQPILQLPYIVTIGSLGQMIIEVSHEGPQETFMHMHTDEYIIIKGSEHISFHQFIYRLAVNTLRKAPELNLRIEVGTLKLKESNVLYELKGKPGYRFNGHFTVEVKLNWDFFAEDLDGALLHHVNTGKDLQINLQGTDYEILNKVLLSTTKRNYVNRGDCIIKELGDSKEHFLLVCLADPDQEYSDPHRPAFSII